MAKVTMICGKICSGKTTEAKKLGGVRLSCDELMLSLLPEHLGENHARQLTRTKNYLALLAVQIVKNGADVVLDWGFWAKKERDVAREFFRGNDIETKLVYLEISEEEQLARLGGRNSASDGKNYRLDEDTIRFFNSKFEPLSPDEL